MQATHAHAHTKTHTGYKTRVSTSKHVCKGHLHACGRRSWRARQFPHVMIECRMLHRGSASVHTVCTHSTAHARGVRDEQYAASRPCAQPLAAALAVCFRECGLRARTAPSRGQRTGAPPSFLYKRRVHELIRDSTNFDQILILTRPSCGRGAARGCRRWSSWHSGHMHAGRRRPVRACMLPCRMVAGGTCV